MRTSLSEFAFFQYLSQLFLTTYFVKCRRTLLELNSLGPYPSTEREIKFGRCMFTSSLKREAFSRRSCAKTGKEICVQSCCSAYKIYCFLFVCLLFFFLTFSLPSASLDLKVPNDSTVNNNSPIQDYIHPNDQIQPTFEITPGFKSFTHQKKHPGKYRKNNKNYKVSKSSDLYSVFSDSNKNSCYFCDFCDIFATLLGLFFISKCRILLNLLFLLFLWYLLLSLFGEQEKFLLLLQF